MPTERKARKSVAFSEGTTVMDSNGDVTEMNGTSDKSTAESHTASMLSTYMVSTPRKRGAIKLTCLSPSRSIGDS